MVSVKKKKCPDAFKGFSSHNLDDIQADISTLLLYIPASFKDALVGVPVRKLV